VTSLGVFLRQPGMGYYPVVHDGVTPVFNLPVPICTSGWREALGSKVSKSVFGVDLFFKTFSFED